MQEASLLQCFWGLAEVQLETRVQAAQSLLDIIAAGQVMKDARVSRCRCLSSACVAQPLVATGGLKVPSAFYSLSLCPCLKQGGSDGICSELEYTIKRLVRGLASNRAAARQGFATALAELLAIYKQVTVAKGCFCVCDSV
jgi:hypothetical protein